MATESPDSLLLIGMGGSAMAAAAASLASPVPAMCHRGYGVPAQAARNPLVIGVSYSGNTEETLDGLRLAHEQGLPVAVVAAGGTAAELAAEHEWPLVEVPGGLQPRAAIGYQVAAVAALIEAAFGHSLAGDLVETAGLVERIIASSVLADDLAEAIGRRAPVVYGTTGPGALAASRWKTQINENAKRPAFAQELPEANHNDLQGWYGPDGGNGFTAVMLQDDHADSRLLARLAQTESVMSSRVPIAGTVRSAGVSALSRFFTLAVVGDLVSVALAEAAQVDPMPVTALESFKRSLMATAPLDGKETP